MTLPAAHPLVDGRTAHSSLVRAYSGERPRRRPVWFMRQAGRSLPEYRALRAGTQMLEACLDPGLASEITLQPVRRHDVNAAIFFSDIVVPLRLAGVDVEIKPGVGPVLGTPVRTAQDVERLRDLGPLTPQHLAPVTQGVERTVAALGGTPLIGFAGAPFTLAAYLVEGGPSRDHLAARTLMHADPATWSALTQWAADVTGAFLRAQVLAGASAAQLFDSWAGSLSLADYVAHVAPASGRALSHVQDLGVRTVHFGTGTSELLVAMRDVGADVVGVDYRLPLDEANRRLGGRVPLQGNIDPALLAAPWPVLEAHVRDVVARGEHAPGHVVNLGHGVPPDTDPDVLTRVVRLVHELLLTVVSPQVGTDDEPGVPVSGGAAYVGDRPVRHPSSPAARPGPADATGGAVDGTADWDAIVVGAGVAGLVAARELAIEGLRTLVLEGRDAPGGAVRAHTVAGLRLDAGADSFATRGGAVAGLLDELGLADRTCSPEPHGAWAHLRSGDGPLPRTGLLGIPADPRAADVRRTIGLVGSLRARLDLVLPARVGARETTLGGLVRSRMGRRVLDRLVRPVVTGVHAADPDELAVAAVSPGLPEAFRSAGSLARGVAGLRASAPAGSAVQGVEGGMHGLVDALVDDLLARGGAVRVRSRVGSLTWADGSDGAAEADRRFGVVVDGSSKVLRTDRLVLATPAAPRLLTALRPGSEPVPLDAGAAVTLVTLVLDCAALDDAPRGTGVLVGPDVTDVTAKALTHATAKWGWLGRAAGPGRHVVRLSFGRADGHPGALPATEDALVELARHDAAVLLGVPLAAGDVVGHAVVRWTQALPRPSAAHAAAVESVRAAVAEVPGAAVCGAWVAGNGLAAVVPDARAAGRRLVAERVG